MIKYNLENINDWNNGSDNIKKVYYNGKKIYERIGKDEPYTRLEYIENTAVVPNQKRTNMLSVAFADSVTGDASAYTYTIVYSKVTALSSNGYRDVFGNNFVQCQYNKGAGYNLDYLAVRAFGHLDYFTTPEISQYASDTFELTISQGEGDEYPTARIHTVGNDHYSSEISLTGSWSASENIYTRLGLFHFYNVSDAGARTFDGRIMEVKVVDRNGNVLCDAVPVKRKSDGKLGFYNIPRDEFETDDSGLLTLVAGPELP